MTSKTTKAVAEKSTAKKPRKRKTSKKESTGDSTAPKKKKTRRKTKKSGAAEDAAMLTQEPNGTDPAEDGGPTSGPVLVALPEHETTAASPAAPTQKEAPLKAKKGRPTVELVTTSAMHAKYGGLLRPVFRFLFGDITYPPDSVGMIHDLNRRGTVIYTTRSSSVLRALYFNYTLGMLGLPLAQFVGGVNLLLWQPVSRIWRLLRQGRNPPSEPWWGAFRERFADRQPTTREKVLAVVTGRGNPAFLFLAGRRMRDGKSESQSRTHDYVRTLVALQRVTTRPIFLVPHILTDPTFGGKARRSLADRLLGEKRYAGNIRLLGIFLSAKRGAQVRTGEVLDLKKFVKSYQELDDDQLARKVRHELRKRMSAEDRVIAGPELSDLPAMQRRVLKNPMLRRALEEQAKAQKTSVQALEKQVESHLKEIAARYSTTTTGFLGTFLAQVFKRIYDGVLVDQGGLRQVLEVSRQGPVIYCPSHRSHIDYLVLSTVLWRFGVTPPHIAAGVNLSFFPLGHILRGGGAFFLRRSFRDDPVYATTLKAYVAELLKSGTSIEFFPEGTRSRTGKLLMPRFGLLSMIIDAYRRGEGDNLHFVPVSIDYERIIEAGAYIRELSGQKKRGESIGGLLKSTKILRSRYGRVIVQFGEPMAITDLVAGSSLERTADGEQDSAWRRWTEGLGYRILHQVGRICSVTPTSVAAASILSYHGRGLSFSRLTERSRKIVAFLEGEGARLSSSLVREDTFEAAISEALLQMVDDGFLVAEHAGRSDLEQIYHVPEEQRVPLDYHKNALMNYFAPAALVSRALFVLARKEGAEAVTTEIMAKAPSPAIAYDEARRHTRCLSFLFKREFLYAADSPFGSRFLEVAQALARRGIVELLDEAGVVITIAAQQATTQADVDAISERLAHARALRILDYDTLEMLSGLLDSFIETYWVTAQSLNDLKAFPLWWKELQQRALDRCRRAYLEGEIKRSESANKAVVEAALAWMQDVGVITVRPEGKRRSVMLAESYADEDGKNHAAITDNEEIVLPRGLDALIQLLGSYR